MQWLCINTLLLATWVAVHGSVAAWLGRSWLRQEGQLHLVLALVLLAVIGRSLDPKAALARLRSPPRASWAAWTVAAAPPLVAAILQRGWPLDVVAAAGAVVSAYGVLGLYLDDPRWRAARGPALLAAAVLPLTGYLDVYLGFPLRKLTAAGVAWLLSPAEVTAGTVLAVDGGYAYVDLPCSGIRSLWSGGVVLLGAAATWRRPVDLGWGLVVGAVSALLVATNGVRVLAVVGLEHVLGMPLLAEIVHVPLGVVGFVGALAPGLFAIWLRGPVALAGSSFAATGTSRLAAPALALVLAATVAVRGLPVPDVRRAPTPVLPAAFTALPLEDQEIGLVESRGGTVVKGRFDGALHGSVVMVSSGSWLAHHVPEACLEAAGFALSGDHPARVGGVPVRWTTASQGGRNATALWWFQSVDTCTDDHVVRIRAGLSSDEPWVLVSVLVEGTVEPEDAAVVALVSELRASVAHTLGGT